MKISNIFKHWKRKRSTVCAHLKETIYMSGILHYLIAYSEICLTTHYQWTVNLCVLEDVLKHVLLKPTFHALRGIPLCNNTVRTRIDILSSDIESFSCNFLQTTYFSIQLDDSTLPGILAYVWFIMEEKIHEELLFAKRLETDTKSESIFQHISTLFRGQQMELLSCSDDIMDL